MDGITCNDVRPEVQAFAVLMEQHLRINDNKGGWKDCGLDFLLGKLVEEFAELYSVANSGPMTLVSGEAADIANIAMMICDVHGLLPVAGPIDKTVAGASELLDFCEWLTELMRDSYRGVGWVVPGQTADKIADRLQAAVAKARGDQR